MKHLIIAAHPSEASFTMSVARSYAAELEKLGHVTHTCDLYRIDFNPVLEARELARPEADHSLPADIRREQVHVRSADALAFVYPLWWASMPAIMKGYIDRVFSYGFAYDFQGNTMRGLLAGKKAVVITVSGAQLQALVKSGEWDAIETLADAHIFRTCGIELVEHLHFGEVVPGLSSAVVDRHLARVRACAQRHFSSARA